MTETLDPGVDPRTPPQDLDAEQSVLGAAMLSRTALDDLAGTGLAGPDFYRPANELIWDAIVALHAAGQPVDAVTVADRLRTDGHLGRVGGPAYLHTLISSVPTAANATWYAKTVRRCSALRRVVEAGTRLAQAGYDPGTDPAEVLDACQSDLAHLADGLHGDDFSTDLATAVDEALTQIEEGVPSHPTGIPRLDDTLRGWIPGTLTTLAARPGVGKSAIAWQSALHLAVKAGLPVGYTSLEMPRPELIQRGFAHIAQVDYGRIQRNHSGEALTDAEWRAIAKARAQIETSPLHLTDRPWASVSTIRHDIRSFTRTVGMPPVAWFIDYLQLMTPSDRRVPREQQVAEITRSLKLLAKDTKVAIVMLSQLNREGAKTGRQPVLTDLRESGAVEQDSDRVILLHRDTSNDEEADPNELVVIVAKNRQGQCGTVSIRWDGTKQTAWAPWSSGAALRGQR